MGKHRTLEEDAIQIRLRTERRLGEMIAAQKTTVGLNEGAKPAGSEGGKPRGKSAVVADDRRLTLADAGIGKDLSSRAQKFAAVPEEPFEAALKEHRRDVAVRHGSRNQPCIDAGFVEAAARPSHKPQHRVRT